MSCNGSCTFACGHRRLVEDYRAERERQLTAIENQTEREPTEYHVITFKEWLRANGGRGRRRPNWTDDVERDDAEGTTLGEEPHDGPAAAFPA